MAETGAPIADQPTTSANNAAVSRRPNVHNGCRRSGNSQCKAGLIADLVEINDAGPDASQSVHSSHCRVSNRRHCERKVDRDPDAARAHTDSCHLRLAAYIEGDTKEGGMAHRKGRKPAIRPIDPLVKLLLSELDARGESLEAAAVRAGLGKDTIGTWVRARRVPNIGNMRAALGAVGFTLAVVKRSEARQGPVVGKI